MTAAELHAEYRRALHGTELADLAPLREAGVGSRGISLAAPAAALIRRHGPGGTLFEPHPDGKRAFVFPVRVDSALSPEAADPDYTIGWGQIIDMIAMHPLAPSRWAQRTGAADWLGCVEAQYMGPAPTPIWRTPLHWLGNNCRGLVLLSRDRRAQYRVLSWLDSILAEDERHAAELRDLLARPWLAPPVFCRRGREVRRHAA
jgi:hypothetical protein